MPKRITNDDFIKKSIIIHSDKYLYDKCKYIGNRVNVIITCPEHGDFIQLPHNHLEGKGCQVCGGSKKYTKESFIEKSKIKHNDKYNYDLVEYVDFKTKIKIICSVHGVFEQLPQKHINGSGCQICGGSIKLSTIDFIEKSNKIHNFTYNYESVTYIKYHSKVDIICKKHGVFEQIASNHLKGVGCPKCSNKHKPTNEEFIDKSNKIHNFLYNYDHVEYINCKTEVDIKCQKHGIFKQTPNSHLRGRGCTSCQNSNGEIKIEHLLKENKINFKKQYSFDDLIFKKKLKFDFAIFDGTGNLKCLIEYNGTQHYKPNEYFGGKSEFEITLKRDKLKMVYCKQKNINIFIIRYDENIDVEMFKIINYLKN